MDRGISYRPEVDGLRAISVVSVLLFHADWNWAKGGFVGVDVFFVISGFLITSLILKERDQGFSFAAFYERRIRRLLPPLIPVLAATWLAAFYLLPQAQFSDFTNSLYATLALVSNWYFRGAWRKPIRWPS